MRSFRFVLISFCLALFIGCVPYYKVLENTPAPMFKNYDRIFVGWIDLDESSWRMYGYGSQEDWKEVIKTANTLSKPQYFEKYMPQKKITTASSMSDLDPRGADLYIKFSNVRYIADKASGAKWQMVFMGPGGGRPSMVVDEKDSLAVTIDFIDVKEGRSLYTVTVQIYTTSGSGYYGMTLENRINSAFYNTVAFIDEKLKGK
jgi:hypothetical protein